MSAREVERPLFLDMDFEEALGRFAQTRPQDVRPPPSKKRKEARPKPGAQVEEAVIAADKGGASAGSGHESGAPDCG